MAKVNWNVVVARVVDIEKLFLKDEQVDSILVRISSVVDLQLHIKALVR